MKYFSVFLLLLLSLSNFSLGQRAIDPELQKKIDDFVQDVFLPAAGISGMGLTIVKGDGSLLYTTGYGLADRAKNIPNGNMTQFLIGSISKSFTSVLAIKHLHEKFPGHGEGVLDTPIRQLLPEVNFTLMDRFRSEHATFRDLLAHRMCLFRDDLQLIADPFNETEEITYRTRYNGEICGVRGDFQYNNQMYVMAGELIGIIAGKPYEDAMQDLLNELGMTNTAFVQRTDDFSNMPNRAMPYYVMDGQAVPINTDLVKRVKLSNAAGGLFVPPEDMAQYIKFLGGLGTIDGKVVVPKEVMEWLAKPSNFVPMYVFKESEDDLVINQFGYGLGFFLSDYDGWWYIQHGGYFPPYLSQLSLYPTQSLGIFSSANEGPMLVHPMVLHSFIFETIKGSPNAAEKAMQLKESLDAEKKLKAGKVQQDFQAFWEKMVKKSALQPRKTAADIVGKYGSGSAGDLEVSERFNEGRNQTEFYLKYGPWYSGWLVEEVEGVIYKIDFDTDVIQDDYAAGARTGSGYVAFDEDWLITFSPAGEAAFATGMFRLGVSLDKLPPVPWAPDSCGPVDARERGSQEFYQNLV